MRQITIPARLEELDGVLEFIDNELSCYDCPQKPRIQLAIAVEEIFVNISHYAYHPVEGKATICCQVTEEPLSVTVQFMDGGKPYNPLERSDPNTTLSAEERDIGGLGIFMVKKSMDSIDYSYSNGKNILTIKKKI